MRWYILLVPIFALVAFELPQLVSEGTEFTSFVSSVVYNNNFHTVEEGRFYRSAQMSNAELENVIKEKGIKSVIDLRFGKGEPEADGKTEKDAVREAGAAYYHVPLLGSRVPAHRRIEKLLEVYSKAEEPILVHCTSGTHRSGVAATIWLIDKVGKNPEAAAKEQLSLQYGFVGFERDLKGGFQGYPTIDDIVWQYLDDVKSEPQTFVAWYEAKKPAYFQ